MNVRDTGQPLYSQQAKNIWLAVYGNTEYRRWDEENSAISLVEVVQRDPVRFAENWIGNIVAFAGSGGARSAEFERAVQLRLLAWPFNLLALAGLVLWAVRWRRERGGLWLLVWAGLYLVGISVGFLLPRFALPLVQVYVVAAAWLVGRSAVGGRRSAVVALLIVVVCAPQSQAGAQNVLNQQLVDERAIAQAILATVPADAAIAALVEPRTAIGKYSAVAHRLTDIETAPPADVRWLVAEGNAPAGWRLVVAAGDLGLYSR